MVLSDNPLLQENQGSQDPLVHQEKKDLKDQQVCPIRNIQLALVCCSRKLINEPSDQPELNQHRCMVYKADFKNPVSRHFSLYKK